MAYQPIAAKEVAFSTTTVQTVASTDGAGYRWVSVQVVTQGGSSTITFQTSNDNATWVTHQMQAAQNGAGNALASSTTGTGIFYGPLVGRYFRLSVTGIVSGTTAGTIQFLAEPAQTLVSDVYPT